MTEEQRKGIVAWIEGAGLNEAIGLLDNLKIPENKRYLMLRYDWDDLFFEFANINDIKESASIREALFNQKEMYLVYDLYENRSREFTFTLKD